jgi:hypothetical protein
MISCRVPVCTNHGFREPTFGVLRWVMSTHQEELRTADVKLLSRAIAGRSMYNMDKAVPGSCLVLSCLVLSCLVLSCLVLHKMTPYMAPERMDLLSSLIYITSESGSIEKSINTET